MKNANEVLVWGQTYAAVIAPLLHNSSISPKKARETAIDAANDAVEDFRKVYAISNGTSLKELTNQQV